MCQRWWFSHTSICSLWKNRHFSGTSRTSLTNSPTGKEQLCQEQIWSQFKVKMAWLQVTGTVTQPHADRSSLWCAWAELQLICRSQLDISARRQQTQELDTPPQLWHPGPPYSALPSIPYSQQACSIQQGKQEEEPIKTSNTHSNSPPPLTSHQQQSQPLTSLFLPILVE